MFDAITAELPPPRTSSLTCGGFFDVPSCTKTPRRNRRVDGRRNFLEQPRAGPEGHRRVQLAPRQNRARSSKPKSNSKTFTSCSNWARPNLKPPRSKSKRNLRRDLAKFFKELDTLELRVFLNGPHDKSNCIFSINAGAGGTEARTGRKCSRACISAGSNGAAGSGKSPTLCPGEGAGIKSVTMLIKGENAYGFCKAERGVHRLVRISPFDSNKRRHTSFSSVDVIAEIDETSSATSSFRRVNSASIPIVPAAKAART